MTQRSDSPLIRHLTQTYGPETAKDWQRPPLVLLPGGGFINYLNDKFQEINDPSLLQGLRMPWRDVVFDFRDGHRTFVAGNRFQMEAGDDLTDRFIAGGYWMRISTVDQWMRNRKQSTPWMADWNVSDYPLSHSESIVIEGCEEFFMNSLRLHPFSVATEAPGGHMATLLCDDRACRLCSLDQKQYEAWCTRHVAIAFRLLAYLIQCNEYLAQVSPPPKLLPKNQQKVHQAKPWLNESLPHYILLDPTRVAEYGHPSGVRAPSGHHASPHPHTRRGHWAALKHDKFARNEDGSIKRVWRKQAWVGATEWTDGLNQRYRVVLPIEQDDSQRVKLAERERVTSTVSTSSAHAGV